MPETAQPLFSSIPDAARRLGVGRTKVYELIQAGKLRPVKLGTRTLLPEGELQKFAAELIEHASQ
ncbi:helix-turn-helix transcriptional regulator [Elongatibacter sediminis]|uniref:Helix-turn-helix domain-containing protein n=1 Tax=Elongatibacter sediminis TaxID=3119006 RepID=A0AAW9RIT4_9GAMM